MTQAEFDALLRVTASESDRKDFIRKYLFHGTPFVFKDREDEYFEFRNRIARHFGVSFQEVFIVGSAKLGFSFVKRTTFSYESDVDVVIVNDALFEEYCRQICDFQYQMDVSYKMVSLDERTMYNQFLRYLVKGWMRPDKLPVSFQVDLLKNGWFDFFTSISHGKSEVGNYQVTGALYRNYYYLEKYHLSGIERYYKSLMVEGE